MTTIEVHHRGWTRKAVIDIDTLDTLYGTRQFAANEALGLAIREMVEGIDEAVDAHEARRPEPWPNTTAPCALCTRSASAPGFPGFAYCGGRCQR